MDLVRRFQAKYVPEPNSGCWLWTGACLRGYGRFEFRYKNCFAHRVSWLIFRGDIPDGMCVLHHCDTPACVNPDHLFLGTLGDNARDCIRKGRHSMHIVRLSAKLSPADVREIRDLYSEGIAISTIARQFPVHRRHVGRIVHGKAWAFL